MSMRLSKSPNQWVLSDFKEYRTLRKKREMSDFLPDELVIEILKRLPVKSLLRFRCVSKSWYSLITNSTFIAAHINHSINKNNNSKLILRHRSHTHLYQDCYSLHSDNDNFDKFAQLQTPFPHFSRRFRIVGCCNGLICASRDLGLHISGQTSIILWNPSIRKYYTLPIPCIGSISPPIFSRCVLGFGIKPVSNDYKVVRIMYFLANDGSTVASPEVELYELNTGLWRALNNVVAPPYLMSRTSSPANVEGALHWVASNRSTGAAGGFQSLIVSFDMDDEVFGEIMLPTSLANERASKLSVAAFGNSISLFHYYKQGRIKRCCLWVMTEYGVVDSWSKVCTIDLRQGIKSVLGFRKNGEVLLATAKRELYSYDLKNRKTRNLGIHGTTHSPHDLLTCSLYVDAYVESLVLLEQADRVLAVEGNLNDSITYSTTPTRFGVMEIFVERDYE